MVVPPIPVVPPAPVPTITPVAAPTPPASPAKPISSIRYQAGAEKPAPKPAPKPEPKPEPQPAPKPSSSLRYVPGGEPTPVRARRGWAVWAGVAAVVLVLAGVGYYRGVHVPAVERAAADAALAQAGQELATRVAAAEEALARRDWAAAESALSGLPALARGQPPDFVGRVAGIQRDLGERVQRGREQARLTAMRVPVFLTTEPAGAEILVNGESRGLAPIRGLELPLGEFEVTARLKDHETLVQKLVVAEGGTAQWTLPLARSTGTLQVSGTPLGATYRVFPVSDAGAVALLASSEGRLPSERLTLPVGTYEVVVRSPGAGGEITQRQRLTVRRAETTMHSSDVSGGTLTITTEPAGATVLLNGVEEGRTPLTLNRLPYGETRQLEVRREGYVTQQQAIQLPPAADQPRTVALKLVAEAGARLRPDFTRGPARLYVQNRARNSMTMRTTVNGQTTPSGPSESDARSQETVTFSEPGPDGNWRRAVVALTEGSGFQAGTLIQFDRGRARWEPKFVRGGFTLAAMSVDYLYPSYPGLALVGEALPDGKPEVGRTWEVPLSLTGYIVAGSQLQDPTGTIRGRITDVDPGAAPAWAEVEYRFEVSGAMPRSESEDGTRTEMRAREVGTLSLRLQLAQGYVSQARLDKRSLVEGTTTMRVGSPMTFTSEIVTTIDSTASAEPSAAGAFFGTPSSGAAATPALGGLFTPPAEAIVPGAIYELAQLDQRPVPRVQTPPVYPTALRRREVTGTVNISFVVDEQGLVQSARVVSSDHKGLEEPALAAVRSWKFTPGRKAGRAVPVRLEIPIAFSLEN